MSAPVTRTQIIGALLRKELKAYSRDTLYLFLTGLVLIAIVVIFWVVPDTVEEQITLAVSPPVAMLVEDAREELGRLGATDEQLAELDQADLSGGEEGLDLVEFDSAEDLRGVVEGRLEAWRTDDGDLVLRDRAEGDERPANAERLVIDIGIAFPPTFISDVAAGRERVEVTVYSDAGVPAEIQGAMRSFVREAGYQLAGRELPVTMPDDDRIVLGSDRVGDQVSLRDKLIPMMAFLVLLMETFSMSSLISVEVLQRTATAILVTPARVSDFLAAKTIFGTGLALGQGLIVLALVGAFTADNWSVLIVTMLLGAMMFTGIAMVVGSSGKDFMGQLFYSMLFIIPLMIPTFSVLFPGSAAAWVRAMPTYPIINTLVETSIYEAGWSEVWSQLLYALAWVAAIYGIGLVSLKRKVESL
jgi:ABC-2 type transport system permease protein